MAEETIADLLAESLDITDGLLAENEQLRKKASLGFSDEGLSKVANTLVETGYIRKDQQDTFKSLCKENPSKLLDLVCTISKEANLKNYKAPAKVVEAAAKPVSFLTVKSASQESAEKAARLNAPFARYTGK